MKLRLQVRGRLFLASLGVVGTVILIAGVFAHLELRAWVEARVEGELATKLAAARFAVESSARPADDAFADGLGAALAARVTLIRDDGVVVGDSEVETAMLGAVENHRERPEVKTALRGKPGRERRNSATVHKDMVYMADRFTRADGGGVVRVAADFDDVDRAVARLRLLLAFAGGLGLIAAVVMSAFASTVLSRTLRSLVRHARALAAGGGDARPRVPTELVEDADEISGLAGTLQRLADDLGNAVTTLAAERDRFAAVLEAMSEGVLGLDADGHVVLVNAAARTLLQTSSDGVGKPLLELSRVPELDDVARQARGGAVASAELELHAPSKRILLVRAAPVRAGGAVVVLHDVSEVRRLERVRRDFVGNVSHELRTPVSVIRASAETLVHGGVDAARAQGFLEAIERNAERLTRLVGDLLDLSRIEAGQVTLAKENLLVADVCARAVGNVDAQARAHVVTIEVPAGMGVNADAKALDQVLVNLLDNAVKYTPSGGHITLRARPEVDGVRIEVEDDGPGIEQKHRARLFERFYRVDPGRSRDVGGTGLGLSIVKHLVELMGGRVGVEPAAPRGSLFWVTVPEAAPDRANVTSASHG